MSESDTPRTNAVVAPYIGRDGVSTEECSDLLDHARQLERELAAAKADCEMYRAWWERDSKALGVVIGERNTARAVAVDRRAQALAAERERDALRADAERYRWLRERMNDMPARDFVVTYNIGHDWIAVKSADELDAAIDRERAK